MRITIEPTNQITTFGGAAGRVWTGVTDRGTKCKLIVRAVMVLETEDRAVFEAELQEIPAPPEAGEGRGPLAIPLRHIL